MFVRPRSANILLNEVIMRRQKTNEPGVYKLVAPDGRWISTQVAYRDRTRKLRWQTFSGPNTLTAAKQWKSKNVDARRTDDRGDRTAQGTTLGEVYDAQLAGRRYAPGTLRTRREIRGRAGLSNLFDRPIGKIVRRDVDAAVTATTSSPGMAKEIRKAISAAFGYAREAMGLELTNPAASSKLRRTRSEIVEGNGAARRVLTRDELRRLIPEMPERYRALVELIGRVGLRPGEAYGLTVDQVAGDEILIGETSKTGKPRTIPIPVDLADTLRDHVERFGAGGLAFPTEAGRVINERNWRRRVFQPAARRAGLGNLVPYDLRHTACSTALSLGVDPVTVANMSGHTVTTLLRTYAHSIEDAKRRAADVLGAAWRGEER